MADFGHLKSAKKATVPVTLWNVEGEPILTVRFAGESNKPFFQEKLRRAEHLQKRKAKITPELIKESRSVDRELFAKHVVTGWEKVVDASGAVVKFTKEDCEAFLRALDDDEFDALREFCGDATNFVERVMDGQGAAGNSQPV